MLISFVLVDTSVVTVLSVVSELTVVVAAVVVVVVVLLFVTTVGISIVVSSAMTAKLDK